MKGEEIDRRLWVGSGVSGQTRYVREVESGQVILEDGATSTRDRLDRLWNRTRCTPMTRELETDDTDSLT